MVKASGFRPRVRFPFASPFFFLILLVFLAPVRLRIRLTLSFRLRLGLSFRLRLSLRLRLRFWLRLSLQLSLTW